MTVGGENPVAEQTNWRLRVARELHTSKHWHGQWGYLADETPGRGQDALDAFRSGPAFHSVVGLALKEDVRDRLERTRSQGDSLDSFVRLHLVRQSGREMRMMPKAEFSRPLLTSHQIGWGNNLERFGQLTLRLR